MNASILNRLADLDAAGFDPPKTGSLPHAGLCGSGPGAEVAGSCRLGRTQTGDATRYPQ